MSDATTEMIKKLLPGGDDELREIKARVERRKGLTEALVDAAGNGVIAALADAGATDFGAVKTVVVTVELRDEVLPTTAAKVELPGHLLQFGEPVEHDHNH